MDGSHTQTHARSIKLLCLQLSPWSSVKVILHFEEYCRDLEGLHGGSQFDSSYCLVQCSLRQSVVVLIKWNLRCVFDCWEEQPHLIPLCTLPCLQKIWNGLTFFQFHRVIWLEKSCVRLKRVRCIGRDSAKGIFDSWLFAVLHFRFWFLCIPSVPRLGFSQTYNRALWVHK